jgi:GPH family glycoside/pentoside/hexuronide:cation symporter
MTETEKLPRRTKFIYGAGDLGFSLTSTIIGVLFGIYLTDAVGLRPGLAAIAVFVGRSWDYINDPLIGYLSDRTRTRWGRRRPFLLFGAIPYGLAFALLWWKPPIPSQIGLVAYYAGAYFLYEAAATFVYMPYFALTPELTLDYDERTALTSYRMAFSILGSLVSFIVPMMIINTMRPENTGRVLLMGGIFGAVSAAPLLLVFMHTRERPEFQNQDQPGIKDSLRAATRNRPFLFAAGVFLLTWTAMEIVQAMLLFFIKHRLGREEQSDLIAGTVFVVGMLVLPLWEWASRRWDKRMAYIAGVSFWAVVQIALVVVNPNWSMAVILTLAALAGIGVSAAHVLPWSMIPDAVEWDEWTTGQRHEGIFYSLTTLAKKVAASIAVPLTLLMLELTGYVPTAAQQPSSVVRGIQILMGPVPAVLLCAGIGFAIVYPLSRERHSQIRAELAAQRQGGTGVND